MGAVGRCLRLRYLVIDYAWDGLKDGRIKGCQMNWMPRGGLFGSLYFKIRASAREGNNRLVPCVVLVEAGAQGRTGNIPRPRAIPGQV